MLWLRIVMVASVCWGCSGGIASADEGKKGKAPDANPAKEAPDTKKQAKPSGTSLDLGKLKLPSPGYAEKLKLPADKVQESAGLKATLEVAPDAYRYHMALGMEELRKASYGKVEIEKKLRELYAKHKAEKGKAIYFLSLSSSGGKDHHFTQAVLKDHVQLRGKSTKTFSAAKQVPEAKLATWQVFEQKRDQRNVLKKNLAELTKATMQFSAEQKEGDKEPLTLSVKNLVRITDRREEQKKDYRAFEGINVGLKQISSSDWNSQIVPEIKFKMYPGTWEAPPAPAGFDELLKMLEANP